MNIYNTDHFSTCPETGEDYAGKHILVDFWDVKRMGDLGFIQKTLKQGALEAGAVILHEYYHPFGEGMGVSGVTVLAESHISIHTWPERDFASVDIFMCGACDPERAMRYIAEKFGAKKYDFSINKRGRHQPVVRGRDHNTRTVEA